MNLFYPKISGKQFLSMVGVTAVGCLVAGAYGILHDQVTYTISPEYFTRLKFDQFDYAEPSNGSQREFAARIGFLATWWVGGITAWVFARVGIMREKRIPPRKEIGVGFVIVFATSMVSALCGWLWGLWRIGTGHSEGWLDWMHSLGVTEPGAFMTVAYIHNASYIGGVVGTFLGLFYLARMRMRRR